MKLLYNYYSELYMYVEFVIIKNAYKTINN